MRQNITLTTIWSEPAETKIVFVALLAMANQSGAVYASVEDLATAAKVPLPATEAAIARLMAPDADNSTKDTDGRYIAKIKGGWRFVANAAQRKTVYQRNLMRKRRAEGKA